jgi:hypothetical protein
MEISRRGFLGAILAAAAAPAFVKASSLMPVFSRQEDQRVLTPAAPIVASARNTLLTIDEITREALKILEKEMTIASGQGRSFDPYFAELKHSRPPMGEDFAAMVQSSVVLVRSPFKFAPLGI